MLFKMKIIVSYQSSDNFTSKLVKKTTLTNTTSKMHQTSTPFTVMSQKPTETSNRSSKTKTA